LRRGGRAGGEPVVEGLLLIGVCLFLVFFAWLRNRVLAWLTQAVFGHGSVSAAAGRLKSAPVFASEEEYLQWAAALLAEAVQAQSHAVIGHEAMEATPTGPTLAGRT